jgi:hypothetical protein
MTNPTRLAERLRFVRPLHDAAGNVVGSAPINPDGPEAAAALDAKDAEIARLRERLSRSVVRREPPGNHCTICHGDHPEDYICGE